MIAAEADTKPCKIGREIKLSKNPTRKIPKKKQKIPTLFQRKQKKRSKFGAKGRGKGMRENFIQKR